MLSTIVNSGSKDSPVVSTRRQVVPEKLHVESPGQHGQQGTGAHESDQLSNLADSVINRFEKLSNPRRKLVAELNLHFRRAIWWSASEGTLKVKRATDVIGATAGIVILSPVFFSVIAAITMEDGGAVIYTSKRVGRHGKVFDFYKFRSMVKDADKIKDDLLNQNESDAGVIFKMRNDPRITKVGRFIRRTSIDELPQLFNVLRGDMSLVGPRPPIPEEVLQYKVGDRYRLEVIPGLTCLWQVNGRSNLDFHQQVALDREYIHEQTLLNDILLILRTVPAVFSGQGSY
ncbi:MAG: sugar transferase [Deltaproteobacteria bacterium]|nr:sugar transferase [Deltaproteobacteria bacterium]